MLIIKLQLWVRRDGLSLDFHAGEPPASRMGPTWASVSAEQGPKEKMMKPSTARLLPRAIEKWWQAVARRWAVMSTSRVVYRRNEDSHPARRLGRTALGRQGRSFLLQKP